MAAVCAPANNGERLITYAIPAGSGEIVLNGAAARKGEVGDVVIIMTFASLDALEIAEHTPRVVVVDSTNRPVQERDSAG